MFFIRDAEIARAAGAGYDETFDRLGWLAEGLPAGPRGRASRAIDHWGRPTLIRMAQSAEAMSFLARGGPADETGRPTCPAEDLIMRIALACGASTAKRDRLLAKAVSLGVISTDTPVPDHLEEPPPAVLWAPLFQGMIPLVEFTRPPVRLGLDITVAMDAQWLAYRLAHDVPPNAFNPEHGFLDLLFHKAIRGFLRGCSTGPFYLPTMGTGRRTRLGESRQRYEAVGVFETGPVSAAHSGWADDLARDAHLALLGSLPSEVLVEKSAITPRFHGEIGWDSPVSDFF